MPKGNSSVHEFIKLLNVPISDDMFPAHDSRGSTAVIGVDDDSGILKNRVDDSLKLSNIGGVEFVELLPDTSAVVIGVAVVVVLAVRLQLSLLEFSEFEDLSSRSEGAAAAAEEETLCLDFGLPDRLALRMPPPTGTLRSTPPFVQYRRQLLQKWRG